MTELDFYDAKIKEKINKIFEEIPGLFSGQKHDDLNGSYQVKFTDIDYPWYTVIDRVNCTSYQGEHSSPVVTMIISSSEFMDIFYGKVSEIMALMTGKMKLEGNLVKAIRYSKSFRKL